MEERRQTASDPNLAEEEKHDKGNTVKGSPDKSVDLFQHGRKAMVSNILFMMYRFAGRRFRYIIRSVVMRLEGGEVNSVTLRRIFSAYHQVEVGMYTHGGCFAVGNMPPRTTIGRYSSIAMTACGFNANHPMNLRSSHALFFNPVLGITKENIIPRHALTIGNDVWMGHNSIILPNASSIGDGAVIGAGAVVHKNLPPYAVVTGNPCRIVRYRFSKELIEELLQSRWWERPVKDLLPEIKSFQNPLEGDSVR